MYTSMPYITHALFPGYHFVVSGGLTVALFIMLIPYFNLDNRDLTWIMLWVIYVIALFILAFIQSPVELEELRRPFGVVFKFIFLISTCIILKNGYNFYIKSIYFINYIIIGLSVILFTILAIGVDIEPIPFMVRTRPYLFYYIGLICKNVHFRIGDISVIRICGLANEPGALALIITWLLVLNEFTFKSTITRVFLVISGFLTLSMAFIISLFFMVIYWFVISKNKVKQICILVLTFLIVIIAFQNFSSPAIKSVINDRLLARFQYNPTANSFSGDNRNMLQDFKTDIVNENALFGLSKKKFANDNTIVKTSGVGFLLRNGIFGYVFFYLPFLFLCYKNIGSKKIILLFMLGLNFLQRPQIENMSPMVFLSLLYYSQYYFIQITNKHKSLENKI